MIGPPSRVMRWCCTIFKTGAINRKLTALFKDKTSILAFYGIRRSESASRSKYDRETQGRKISRQNTVSPAIDWMDFDVWLYILKRKIDFNVAYTYGYARVGCFVVRTTVYGRNSCLRYICRSSMADGRNF